MARKPKTDLDALALLLPAKWRGIEFFVGPMSMEFSHSHVQHLYPDRDAGYIESTGRNPATFTITAIFRNGIAGAPANYYPLVYRQFLAACGNRTSGFLVHPELGELKVKCASVRSAWDPGRRDGIDLEVQFVETSDEEGDLQAAIAQPNALPNFKARELDESLAKLPKIKKPDVLKPSLLESLKKLASALDQYKLGIGNVTGQIDAYLNGLQELRDDIESLGDPANILDLLGIDAIYADILRVAEAITRNRKQVAQGVVEFETSVADAASFFGMPTDEFLATNPTLGRSPTVRAGTQVFYEVKE